MSAIIYFSKTFALTLPELIGVSTFAILVITLFIKLFLIGKGIEKETDEKIKIAKDTIYKRIDKVETKKVDMPLFEETVGNLEKRIDENKEDVKDQFMQLRDDIREMKVDILKRLPK